MDFYLEKSKEPNFELDQVRKELEKNDIADEEIKIIVKLVDSELQKRALIGSTNSKSNELMIAGTNYC